MQGTGGSGQDLDGEVEQPGSGKARYLVLPLVIMIGLALIYFFAAGDSETGLILGIFFGSLYLMLDLAVHKVMKFGETLDVFFKGCGSMTGIVAIMVFAYALSNPVSYTHLVSSMAAGRTVGSFFYYYFRF